MYPSTGIRKFLFDEDIETIRLTYLGEGLLYSDSKFPRVGLVNGQVWKRPKEIAKRPLFIDGKPNRFDALQGELDDSWLVSVMEAITTNGDLFKYVVPQDQSFDDNYSGAFHFRIWKLGTWYDVVVDDYLPVLESNLVPCFTHSMKGNVFWAALLEKAYAKFCSVFFELKPSYSYDSINIRDSPILALHSFSGGIIENLQVADIPNFVVGKVKWLLNRVYEENDLMICSCHSSIEKSTGLLSPQSYPVTRVIKFEDTDPDYPGLCLVRLMNPWGDFEWKGAWSDNDWDLWKQIDRGIREKLELVSRHDGEFWMEDGDFIKFFDRIRISHLGPGQYMRGHRLLHSDDWSTETYSGEWVKDVNAAGSDLPNVHKNPQYIIKFEKKKENSQLSNIIIEICHWPKQGRHVRTNIGFFMYPLESNKSYKFPLDFNFFWETSPINKFSYYLESEGRAYSKSLNLFPGEYCIVPCTETANFESQFLLRIFSDYRIITLAIDNDQIGKSLPVDEKNTNECDEELKSLFNDIAQGQDEIDWNGLKEILEAAMNPKRSYLGMISSFFQFLREVFEIFLPFRSSNGYETSAIVFSKDECRSMIAMSDDNHSGKLNFSEFSNLWNKICFWTKVYDQHRDEAQGYVTVVGLRDALSSIGYNVSNRTIISLIYVYANEQGNIFMSDFILCGVTLETVLSLYEKEYAGDKNKISFTLEEWVKNTLIL